MRRHPGTGILLSFACKDLIMLRPLVALLALSALLLVAGCGQKGPLYLPESPANSATTSNHGAQ